MKVEGLVISIEHNTQIKKKAGGTYPGTQLVYKTSDGEIRSQALHENVLKYNEELAKALKALEATDAFEMVKEKDGEYWNVISIKKLFGAKSMDVGTNASNVRAANNSNDDNRQRLIVRQNVLGHAIKMLSYNEAEVSAYTVTDLASQLEEFVFTGKMQTKKEKATEALEELEDDVPY